MINYKDKEINTANQSREYLIDKINAYFERLVQYRKNPVITKKQLLKGFHNQIDAALKIFR